MKSDQTYAPEDIFSALLLIGAFFVFGLLNFRPDEPLVEAGIRAQADAIAEAATHPVVAQVEGRQITVLGLADTEAERGEILAALRGIEGRGRVFNRLEVLAPADPFLMTAEQTGTALILTGAIPIEALRERLRTQFGADVSALDLASGAPDASWGNAAVLGLRALQQLTRGAMQFEGRTLTLSGTVLTPDAAARAELLLEDLPEGYVAQTDFDVLDDGTPLRVTASVTDGSAPALQGKVPEEADILQPSDDLSLSPLPEPFEGWSTGVRTGLGALGRLENGHLAVIGRSFTLSGVAYSQKAYDSALESLADLSPEFQVSTALRLADSGAPFSLQLTRDASRVLASGKVPRSLTAPVLSALVGQDVTVVDLEIASINPPPDWWHTATLGVEALRDVAQGEMQLEGDLLRLSATVADPTAATALRAQLAGLPDGFTSDVTLDLLDDGTPLRLALRKSSDGLLASGKWPSELTLDHMSPAVGGEIAAGEIIRSVQRPPPGWQETALIGAEALGYLTRGELMFSEGRLSLTGTILNPAREEDVQKVLQRVAPDVTVKTDLQFEDDGRPFAFELVYDGQRGRLTGKIPSDLGPASQSAILGAPVEADALTFSRVPADPSWWRAARVAIRALGALERGVLTMDAHQLTLKGQAAAQAKDQIAKDLRNLEPDFKVQLELSTD